MELVRQKVSLTTVSVVLLTATFFYFCQTLFTENTERQRLAFPSTEPSVEAARVWGVIHQWWQRSEYKEVTKAARIRFKDKFLNTWRSYCFLSDHVIIARTYGGVTPKTGGRTQGWINLKDRSHQKDVPSTLQSGLGTLLLLRLLWWCLPFSSITYAIKYSWLTYIAVPSRRQAVPAPITMLAHSRNWDAGNDHRATISNDDNILYVLAQAHQMHSKLPCVLSAPLS